MKPKPFEKLSAAQKRVAIARDVIAQVRAEKFQPSVGYAYRGDDNLINQDELLKSPICGGCAAGAVALSAIRLGNKFEFSGHLGHDQTFKVLGEWFSLEQAKMIENAYELFGNFDTKAVQFGARFDSGNPRIRAIMKNIIRNHGTFRP